MNFLEFLHQIRVQDACSLLLTRQLSTTALASNPRGGPGPVNDLYLNGHDPADPIVSPLLNPNVKGLARCLVAVAEYDGLRLEGEAYGRRLKKAGVTTRVIRYRGVDHAFMDKIGIYPQAEDLMAEIASWVKG